MKILHAGRPSESLERLRNMAESFGIGTDLIDVAANQSLTAVLAKATSVKDAGLVLDVASLKDRANALEVENAAGLLGSGDATVLLLATDKQESTSRFLRTLTKEGVQRVDRVVGATGVRFPVSGRVLSRELSSQTYPRQEKEALTLSMAKNGSADVIMELDGSPAFACFHSGGARIFVWSTTEVFDVHRQLVAEKEFEVATDEYIPVIIFLRAAFRNQCWHNPRVGAGIVIDDPLLKRKYGFIDFQKLFSSARKHGYQITLAFIPWNHWRTRRKELKLFLDYADCFRICLHGCDHTRNEYGSEDYDALLQKNFVARRRMERHDDRTTLRSELLMVCPQEKYSLQAMRAFSDSRQFLGLVCTACMPRNLPAPQIAGADLLLPAQDSFYGFPVFKRHYWNGMGAFAMALFLGKPAILVEHHEFFRNGSDGAEEFVRRLAELCPDLKWRSLTETVTRTHVRRCVSESMWEVRFFTDTFQLEHEQDKPVEYRLIRRIPEATQVERVLIGGKEIPFRREDGFLMFETHAHHPKTVSVQIDVPPVKPTRAYSFGVKYQASVALRRGVSEFRDNVIARNGFASRVTRRVVNRLKAFSG
jgi:hypothetical protein